MKNKIRVLDYNVLSNYLGRFTTLLVGLLVLGLTISALMSDNGLRDQTVLVVQIASPDGGGSEEFAATLKTLLARATGRDVRLVHSGQDGVQCELAVVATREFYRNFSPPLRDHSEGRNWVPLYSIDAVASGGQRAVLVGRADATPLGNDPWSQVEFSGPESLNGFLVQASHLSEESTLPPRSELRFSSTGRSLGFIAAGGVDYSACRQSDVNALLKTGAIEQGDLTVLHSWPAVPELLVVGHQEDAVYLSKILHELRLLFEDPSASPRIQRAVRNLRYFHDVAGVTPVDVEQIATIEALLKFEADIP
jgi:hypothetical protein